MKLHQFLRGDVYFPSASLGLGAKKVKPIYFQSNCS